MKLRNPWLIKLVGLVSAAVLRCWLNTLRFHIVSADGLVHPTSPQEQPFIYAFWHEALLAPASMPTRVHVLISHHVDGELIAQVCRHLGIGVVRGSTNRGGTQALLGFINRVRNSHLAITPDGPRGPRRRVQVGAVFLSSITRLPIIPIGVGYTNAWRFRSWDRFALPVPFSAVNAVLGEPLTVEPDATREQLETARIDLETRLNQATTVAERWANWSTREEAPAT